MTTPPAGGGGVEAIRSDLPPPPHAVRPSAIPIDQAVKNLRYCFMLSSLGERSLRLASQLGTLRGSPAMVAA